MKENNSKDDVNNFVGYFNKAFINNSDNINNNELDINCSNINGNSNSNILSSNNEDIIITNNNLNVSDGTNRKSSSSEISNPIKYYYGIQSNSNNYEKSENCSDNNPSEGSNGNNEINNNPNIILYKYSKYISII